MRKFYPILGCLRRVNQLDDDGSSCHYVRSAGQKVSPNDRLQHTAFAGRLAADYNDLRHFDRKRNFCSVEYFLELVDDWDQFFHFRLLFISKET